MNDNIILEKSKKFAVRIINLYKFLCDEKNEYVLAKQLLRSGTSIGANIAEAQCGISERDFLSKMYIAYKECSETKYWLEILYEAEFLTKKQYESVYGDCLELFKMLTSITNKLRKKESENE